MLDDEPSRTALVKRLHAERCRSERHRSENGLLLLAWYAEEDHLEGTPIPESLRSRFSARAVELRQRFGLAVTAGLLSLARGFESASDGPLLALRDLDAQGLLTDVERESARTVALQKYQRDPGYPHSSHLAALGCPRGAWAPLLQAIDDPHEGNSLLEALRRCSDPALLLQVTTELGAAAPSSARAVALARLGVSLSLPEAVQAGLETLRRVRSEVEVSRVQVLASELVEAKHLTHDELRRELADPHSPRFLLGTHTFETRAEVPPEYVEPLLSGLVGLPRCALAAALCLIGAGRLSHEDPRLPPLYVRLDTRGRETFLTMMLLLGCDPEPWTAGLMDWLTAQPADAAANMARFLTRTPAGTAIV